MENYWGNVLNAFEAGVQMDLRLRLAIDFLKSPGMFSPASMGDEGKLARSGLDLATALLDEAAARGLVKDLPDTGEINAATKRHIERGVSAQVHQVEVQQREARRAGPMVGMPHGTFPQ